MPPNDDPIWAAYAKGVKRLSRQTPKIPAKAKSKSAKTDRHAARKNSLPPCGEGSKNPALRNNALGFAGRGAAFSSPLDHRAEKRLRQGDIELDARIDLHGMTQAEAHAALAAFIAKAVKHKARKLLIITGRGRGGTGGVLRSSLPQWLGALPEASRILALRPASVIHGGDGAFYVLLRK